MLILLSNKKGNYMRNIQTIIFFSIILIFSSAGAFSQHLKIGAGGGLTQLIGPESLTDDISQTITDSGAGFSTEWNIGLIGKIDFPMMPITPRASIYYHSLSGSKEFPEIVANPKIETSQTIIEIGLGAQYNFISMPLGVDPYIALDLFSTSFGDFTKEINGEETKSDGFGRFGGGVGAGTEISIIPVVNLDLCLSYKLLNLAGKDEGEKTISALTLDVFVLFNFL